MREVSTARTNRRSVRLCTLVEGREATRGIELNGQSHSRHYCGKLSKDFENSRRVSTLCRLRVCALGLAPMEVFLG